jgi:pimeloyl-ACP methyl ester carboxylesterase
MKKRIAQIIPLAYGRLFNVMVLFSKRATAIKAFRVFCTIRKGKVLARQRQFLDEAKFKRISIAEHEIQAYRWKGTGDTVLLLHGWESNTFRWRNLIKKLQENNFDILAFDAPAHGYSNGKILHVPLYAEVTRHFLDTFKPTLAVAHSVGGMNIHYVHYLKPESSLKKIVTVGAPAEFEQFMNHYQGLLKFNDKVKRAMNHRLKEWFGYYFNEFTSMRFVEKNTKKGLLFHDEDDLQVPVEASRKVHKHWKGSELVITKGLGHSMHQPEVNEKIIAFLKH